MKPDIYIKSDVINKNREFSLDKFGSEQGKVPFDFAPILWRKKDIEDCIIDQLASKSNNNIYLSLENVVSIIQRNTEEDIYSKKLSRQFYDQHYAFFEVISSENKNAIEQGITRLVNAFMDICYKGTHLLTLDKLFATIMDLGVFSITAKKSYSSKDIIQLELQDYKIVNIIALFFTVIETFYNCDIEESSQETFLSFKYQNALYDSSTDIQNFTKQIINPFQSYMNTNVNVNVALQVQNDIPKFIHSGILFTYLYTFPIIEVMISRYSFHNFLFAKTFNSLADVINIYRLFRFLPIFNKYKFFLSNFPVANHSFINISWFLHIIKNYDVTDISFFEDILLKTFSNEVANIISNKINVKLRLRSLFDFYSLSTNNADIHEKMKSISAFHELKGN